MPDSFKFPNDKPYFLLGKIFLLFVFLFCSFLLQSQVLFNNLEDSVSSTNWIGLETIVSGNAHSGNYFSQVDSLQQYGLGIDSPFPGEIRGKNTWVKFSSWVKSETVSDQLIFVFLIQDLQQTFYWKGVQLAPLLVRENEWFQFVDSVMVPGNLTEKANIKAFLWNADQKDVAGIDDLEFSFKPNSNPSFIPEVQTQATVFSTESKVLFQNQFYRILYDATNQSVSLFGKDQLLFNQLLFYSKTILKNDTTEELSKLKYVSVKKTTEGKQVKFAAAKGKSTSILLIDCEENSNELDFSVTTKLKKNVQVVRQAIVVDVSQEAAEVYRANRKSDTANFQSEYWVGREGVRFGRANNSLFIYHNPAISSMQLNTENNHLWINLDYEKDHPFLHFPLNNDSTDWKLDWSKSEYKSTSKKTYTFSFFTSAETEYLPRFMKNPSGFLATYIWTEHADYTDIRTNRAVYFGSEKITNVDSAIGGFVKYQIPVTKSIFYNNVDQITNAGISGNVFKSLECSFLENSEFQDFLFQLKKQKIEICLHTPEQFTTTLPQLEEALSRTRDYFQSVSWIDHGYNNQLQNNRENLVCDGALTNSTFYAADVWEKYGVSYFWNPFYEDYQTFSGWDYMCSFEKPYSGFGDFFPNPDFWAHDRTPGIWHWPTKSVLFINNDALWEYFCNEEKLENFVSDWGVEINHCYPAWVDPEKGFWVYDNDSLIVASAGFNETLKRMAKLRDEGNLNICTVQDFLEYNIALQSISYQIQIDGRIKIRNFGNSEIQGLSFATKGKAVTVNGLKPKQKRANGELIFWLDLPAGGSRLIRVIQ